MKANYKRREYNKTNTRIREFYSDGYGLEREIHALKVRNNELQKYNLLLSDGKTN